MKKINKVLDYIVPICAIVVGSLCIFHEAADYDADIYYRTMMWLFGSLLLIMSTSRLCVLVNKYFKK